MNRKLSVLLFVVVFGFSADYVYAQNASGVIASSRVADWSAVGVQGGLPNRTTTCATLNPGATAAQINSAIASCPNGQVVYLAAGTYRLSGPIDFARRSNVTLRGAGPDSTFLIFSGSGTSRFPGANIAIYGDTVSQGVGSSPNQTNWTGGFAQGATTLTLGSTSNLSMGHMIILDQVNDSSDTGNVFVCASSSVCSSEGPGGVTRSNRSQVQVSTVTAINGTNVTISPGLYMGNWSSSKSPQAYWPTRQASMDGVENLSIDNSGSSASTGIVIASAINCWVKNVRSLYGNRNHIWLWYSTHISVLDSYFYGQHSYGTTAYALETNNTSDDLIENNIFQHTVTPITIGNDSGDVYAYNFTIDDYYTSSTSWMQAGLFPHAEGTSMDLLEGNESDGLQSDIVHGTHIFITVFRNRLIGVDEAALSRTNNTIPVNIEAYGRYDNLVGNVLGKAGYHTHYQDAVPNSNGDANHTIYVLGWDGEHGRSGSHDDTITVSTLMRWGNYDVVNKAPQWNASEVPSGLSQYANPVPSNQSLPASLFLSSQPSWWSTPWGTPPWPAIGPDVTDGPGPGGHSYDIPAKLCYNNTSKDSNGILNFNATSCYESSAAPSPPTGLTTTPH